jgi:hypothetical protein
VRVLLEALQQLGLLLVELFVCPQSVINRPGSDELTARPRRDETPASLRRGTQSNRGSTRSSSFRCTSLGSRRSECSVSDLDPGAALLESKDRWVAGLQGDWSRAIAWSYLTTARRGGERVECLPRRNCSVCSAQAGSAPSRPPDPRRQTHQEPARHSPAARSVRHANPTTLPNITARPDTADQRGAADSPTTPSASLPAPLRAIRLSRSVRSSSSQRAGSA